MSQSEEKQYHAQLELAKLLNEHMDFEKRDENFYHTIASLMTPPSLQNMSADQMKEFHIQNHLKKIKNMALASTDFHLFYPITWVHQSGEDKISVKIIHTLSDDGYKAEIVPNPSDSQEFCIKVSWN